MSVVLSPSASPFPSPSPPFQETIKGRILVILTMLAVAVNLFFCLVFIFKRGAEELAQQRNPIIHLQPLRLSLRPTATTDRRSRQRDASIGTVAFAYKSPANKPSPGGGQLAAAADQAHSCSICLEDFKVGDECKVLVRCNHVYHKPCVDLWLATNKDCPLCRVSVHGGFSQNLSDIV